MKKVLFLFSAALLLSCTSDDATTTTEEVTLLINHFKTTAILSLDTVFLVQEDEEIGAGTFKDVYTIRNFDFEPGFTYMVTATKNTSQSASSDIDVVSYDVITINSKDAVGINTTFSVPLARIFNGVGYASWLTGDETFGYYISNEIPIDCQQLCPELYDVLPNRQIATGVFMHGDNGAYNLVDLY